MIPNAGIDKIKVILNPFFLNKNYPRHIRPDNALTIHNAGIYTFLAIHAEYCNPNFDYRLTIAQAIYELIEKKVILFPMDYPILTFLFVIQNFNYFILGVSQVEFYFDFPKGKTSVSKDAIKNGNIRQYEDKEGKLKETYYSTDNKQGKTKSSWCIYNKHEKMLHDNRISHKVINNINVEYRIEARLNRDNCMFLDIANLTGSYEDIFKRFKPLLAVLFFNNLYSFIKVKGKSNTYFNRLVRETKKGKRQYMNHKKLKVSESVKITDNSTGKKQMQKVILEKYYRSIKNV